jgi:hypothetical protein
MGVIHIQTGQDTMSQVLDAHREDLARSHAHILEIQEEQHQLDDTMADVHKGQKEMASNLAMAGKFVDSAIE